MSISFVIEINVEKLIFSNFFVQATFYDFYNTYFRIQSKILRFFYYRAERKKNIFNFLPFFGNFKANRAQNSSQMFINGSYILIYETI